MDASAAKVALPGLEVVQLMSRLVSEVYRNEALSEKRLSRTR